MYIFDVIVANENLLGSKNYIFGKTKKWNKSTLGYSIFMANIDTINLFGLTVTKTL